MKTANRMAALVDDLLEQYGQEKPRRRISLALAGNGRLVVEQVARDRLVRVGLYLQDGSGRLFPDPAVLFYIGEEGWIPLEITRVLGGQWMVGALHPQTGALHIADPRGQAALAAYCDLWADNLRLQGWLAWALVIESDENGEGEGEPAPGHKHDPGPAAGPVSPHSVWPEPEDEPPDLETLMAWMEDGGCEATDSCWVEPDGTCRHGHPSWLLRLGLI